MEYIEPCIESLLNQTMADFELIVVDDGSSDGTVKYLQGLSDPRIKLLVLDKNQGLIYARKQAFAAASGQYIALMDSDDIAHPERFEQQLQVLERGDVDICATRYQTLETATQKLRKRSSYLRSADLRALLTIYCPICNPTASFKKEVLDKANYEEAYRHAEDYALWAALSAANCAFAITPEHLLTYRIHPQQISRLKSEQARASFLQVQGRYVAALLDGAAPPQSMGFRERMQTGLGFMRALNQRLPGISVGANYEIYAEFQFRRNGWLTPLLRLERLLAALVYSALGQKAARARASSAG